jgi:hypothetical protein
MGLLEAYGKFQIYGGMLATGFIGFIFFIIGLVILFWRDKVHTAKTKGVYSNVSCSGNMCTGVATYTVGSNTFTLSQQSKKLKNGSKVDIMYDPKNPSDGMIQSHGRFAGFIPLFFGGIFMYASAASYKAFSGANNSTRRTISQVAGVASAAQYFRPGG